MPAAQKDWCGEYRPRLESWRDPSLRMTESPWTPPKRTLQPLPVGFLPSAGVFLCFLSHLMRLRCLPGWRPNETVTSISQPANLPDSSWERSMAFPTKHVSASGRAGSSPRPTCAPPSATEAAGLRGSAHGFPAENFGATDPATQGHVPAGAPAPVLATAGPDVTTRGGTGLCSLTLLPSTPSCVLWVGDSLHLWWEVCSHTFLWTRDAP